MNALRALSTYKKHVYETFLGFFFLFATPLAYAQGVTSGTPGGGFLQPVKSVLDQVIDGIVAISLVVAIGYIIWQVLEVIFDRKTWSDIMAKCLVAVALGAAPFVVKQLWDLGQSLSIG
ncbi:TrbC/VirB2 family protein [Oligella urethralis]|uniref:TrbC/VIRB2 family n=1 Tax=Oligella urethralis TaxID=90245 RepID=A0A2X1UVQ3_9BURK|nr:TrbC/VirB2 family protein [Oligella urethralis]SPY08451.1 TrbC/VIRB2 family [Oligella urethralis]